MSATGSFDHRGIGGPDGVQLMRAFKALVETRLGLLHKGAGRSPLSPLGCAESTLPREGGGWLCE